MIFVRIIFITGLLFVVTSATSMQQEKKEQQEKKQTINPRAKSVPIAHIPAVVAGCEQYPLVDLLSNIVATFEDEYAAYVKNGKKSLFLNQKDQLSTVKYKVYDNDGMLLERVGQSISSIGGGCTQKISMNDAKPNNELSAVLYEDGTYEFTVSNENTQEISSLTVAQKDLLAFLFGMHTAAKKSAAKIDLNPQLRNQHDTLSAKTQKKLANNYAFTFFVQTEKADELDGLKSLD